MNLAPYAVKDMASSSPVPEATYHLRINNFEYNDPSDEEWRKANPNSQAKHPFLNVDLVIQDERVPSVDAGDQMVFGRHLFLNCTFKKGGDFMLRGLIEACGKEEDWMLVDMEGQPHWDELKEAELLGVVVIQPEREDPKTKQKYSARNEIKKFLPLLG